MDVQGEFGGVLHISRGCLQTHPCQHEIRVDGESQEIMFIPNIVQLASRGGYQVCGALVCFAEELQRQGRLHELHERFVRFPVEQDLHCPMGHPLHALGTKLSNGWTCDGDNHDEANKTDHRIDRFRCFRCDWDLCSTCVTLSKE